MSNAIRTPSSRFVYQQLSKYIAPGKNGASIIPRKNRTVRRPAAELVALVHPLTTAHAMIHDGCETLDTGSTLMYADTYKVDRRPKLRHKHNRW
jgi:hypothetical protein